MTLSGRDRTDAAPGTAATSGLDANDLATRIGSHLYRFAGLLFLLAILFRFFEPLSTVLLIAFVGAILGVAFNTVVVRLPLRRGIATMAVGLVLLVSIISAAWAGATAILTQLRALVADLPNLLETLERWEAGVVEATGIDVELLGPRTQAVLVDLIGGVDGRAIMTRTFGILELVAIAMLVLVGALFVVARPNEQLLVPLLRAVPSARRPAFRRMFSKLADRLSGWLFGTLLSMAIIGGLSAVVFTILGVPYSLLLGIVIGILDIIPLVGPWIGGAIAVLITLLHDPGLAIWVGLSVLVIQEVEGNLVRPMVMSQSAKLHPFVTLLALLLFGSIFGILGAILALPITLAIITAVEVLWVEETLEAADDEIAPLVET